MLSWYTIYLESFQERACHVQRAEKYLGALKEAGFRQTWQRRAICEFLAETNTHPTPYQVFAGIAESHPEISRATVYNTLNVLREMGAIVEIAIGSEHTHYDTNPEPHINLICLRCHKIEDCHQSPLTADLQARIHDETHFQPVAARTDILGFCQECRERKRAEIVAQWAAQHDGAEETIIDRG